MHTVVGVHVNPGRQMAQRGMQKLFEFLSLQFLPHSLNLQCLNLIRCKILLLLQGLLITLPARKLASNGLPQARLPAVCGFLTLHRKRFHSTNPGDFESMFIKAGDSKTRKGLG